MSNGRSIRVWQDNYLGKPISLIPSRQDQDLWVSELINDWNLQ